jgi:O-antigen ligase
MAWIRDWSWRLALIALPWQTRWFTEGPSLGGLPWEQGRWAFYLSWIPFALTVLLASWQPFKPAEHPLSKRAWVGVVGLFLIALPVCLSIFPPASVQWLVQVCMLSLFAWAILHLNVGRDEFVAWSVLAIVPEAVLGIGQFFGQQVVGTEWLGMSPQLPATPGVAVIEVAGRRILRAYGGLPHPNILGGWLAYGLAMSVLYAKSLIKRWGRYPVEVCAALFAICLVLTFSRAAWIAAACALGVAFFLSWKKSWTLEEKLRLMSLGAVILVCVGVVAAAERQLVFVRATNDTRLEELSTSERLDSIRAAWIVTANHPVLGTGQNTAILALSQAGFGIIPPHFTLLLILLETGAIGSLGFVLLVGRWAYAVRAGVIVPLLILLPLGLFDHYLWSLWAGQSLVMLAALAPLTKPGE